MKINEVRNEDDFLLYYMEHYAKNKKMFFPKVHMISTLSTSPDIDLLFINQEKKLVVGYEFKVLKYYTGWKRVDYNPLYSGIGEALSYFQHGIDKCYLVLGLTDMPSEWVDKTLEKINEMISNFDILTNLFTGWAKEIQEIEKFPMKFEQTFDLNLNRVKIGENEEKQWGFGFFGVMVWTKRDGVLMVKKNADQHFPISESTDLTHKRECLLRKEFKYKKKFKKMINQ